jgi:WD40 repeat protein
VGGVERFVRLCRRNLMATLLILVSGIALLVVSVGSAWYSVRLAASADIARAAGIAADAAERAAEAEKEAARVHEYYSLVNDFRLLSAAPYQGWTWEGMATLSKAASLETNARNPFELRTEVATCSAAVDLKEIGTVAEGLHAYCLAFSPDGRLLAVGRSLSLLEVSVTVFDVESQTEVHNLVFTAALARVLGTKGKPDGVRALSFSPDGRFLVAGARHGFIHAWDLSAEEPTHCSWPAHRDWINSLVFGPDGRYLFSASKDGTIKRWEVADGWKESLTKECPASVTHVAIAPDGSLLASWGGTSAILSPDDFEPQRRWSEAEIGGWGVWGPRGRMAALAGSRIILYDVANAWEVRELRDPKLGDQAHEGGGPHHMQFSPDGKLLMSSSNADKKLKLWDVASGRLLLSVLIGGSSPVYPAFSPDGCLVATTADRETILYQLAGGDVQSVVAHQARPIRAIDMAPDEDELACLADGWGTAIERPVAVTVWNPTSGAEKACDQFVGDPRQGDADWSIGYCPSRPWLVHVYHAMCVDVWDREKGEGIKGLNLVAPQRLSIGPDGERLWCTYAEESEALDLTVNHLGSFTLPELGQITTWSNLNSEVQVGLSRLNDVSAGRRWVVAGSDDATTKLFSAGSGQPVATWRSPDAQIFSVALAPDESLAVSGSRGGQLQVACVPSGKVVADLPAHRDRVTTVEFHRSGKLLATGSVDRTVHVWRRNGNELEKLVTLRTPSGPVASVRFGHDGSKLAVLIDGETSVRIWHLDRLRQRLAELGLDW